MATVKTDISLSKTLLEEIETVAREMKISRSRLFVMAVKDFIRRYQNRRLVEQFNQAYQGGPDAEEQEWLERARQHYRLMLEREELSERNSEELSNEEFEALTDQLADVTDKMIAPGTQPLSDYALSRESFYEDHPKL